jgi:hypothetical protein
VYVSVCVSVCVHRKTETKFLHIYTNLNDFMYRHALRIVQPSPFLQFIQCANVDVSFHYTAVYVRFSLILFKEGVESCMWCEILQCLAEKENVTGIFLFNIHMSVHRNTLL